MNVLAIGAHPDDIELGCGGALACHVGRGDRVTMLVMTSGRKGASTRSSRVHEQQDAARRLGAALRWGGFDDGSVPDGAPAIAVIDAAVAEAGAGVMYTHAPRDSHQDHRAVAAASLAAARRLPIVLYYETPSSLGFEPTVYVDIGQELDTKLAVVRAHRSQVARAGPVDLEALAAAARFRGFQARLRHAEAFETPRFCWDLASTPHARARPTPTVARLLTAVRS
jgi:LmbE family N-acetylglucosaminyl deacetylase